MRRVCRAFRTGFWGWAWSHSAEKREMPSWGESPVWVLRDPEGSEEVVVDF